MPSISANPTRDDFPAPVRTTTAEPPRLRIRRTALYRRGNGTADLGKLQRQPSLAAMATLSPDAACGSARPRGAIKKPPNRFPDSGALYNAGSDLLSR